MRRLSFEKLIKEEPFHDSGSTYIGLTLDSDKASEMAASNVSLIRVAPHKWPKEISRIKRDVRYVIKEAGCRNFLVVVNKMPEMA